MKNPQFSAWSRAFGVVLFVGLAGAAQAQDISDYLRFSETNPSGSARVLGMGGASTALGADFSSATINPAGLAMFRRGEFTITPNLRVSNSTTNFIGSSGDASRTNFGFGQLGIVFTNPIYRARDLQSQNASGIKSYAIGIGFNQENNFWKSQSGTAVNRFNTFGDALAGQANGSNIDGLGAYQFSAYRSYYIDTLYNPVNAGTGALASSPRYWLPIADRAGLQQQVSIVERGRVNHWTIAGALNINDNFYIGLGIGIMDYNFRSEVTLTESDVNGVYAGSLTPQGNAHIRRMDFTDVSTTTGAGVNGRLGLLFQPLDFFRIGASIQTPTYATLTLNSGPEFYLVDNQNVRQPNDGNLQSTSFEYSIVTPWRANAGVAFIIGKRGILTGDVEYVDYTSGSIKGATGNSAEYFRFLTSEIGTSLVSAINYRVGLEVRPTSKTFVRLGYAENATPLGNGVTGPSERNNGVYSFGKQYDDLNTYNSQTGQVQRATVERKRTTFSGGVGYRERGWFVDFTVSVTQQREVNLVHPLYVTPGELFVIPDRTLANPNPTLTSVPFTTGSNSGGIGGGIEPLLDTKTTFVNVYITVGISLGN